ncbi:unnamed protein product [marine sediment metagenome]|uniref:Uncharacterized protein n=1 Tax=marine sediment metagenome TaxID=412755 RepID=X1HFP1_9ZZZZ
MAYKKKQGYMHGGMTEGSYYCPKCKKAHHKHSMLGKSHSKYKRK